jgi:hypothetical protein
MRVLARARARRGDSPTNIILFLAVLTAALLLVTWYVQAVRPTRAVIASVLDDAQELKQHFANACAASVYRASYAPGTVSGRIIANATHYCIVTEVFGTCEAAPCRLGDAQISLGRERALLRIGRQNATQDVTLAQDLP